MQTRSRRATLIWLILIGLLLSVIFISGAVVPQAQLLILVFYTLMALAGLGVFNAAEVRRRLPERPTLHLKSGGRPAIRRTKTSQAARRAAERASLLPGYLDRFMLQDVGVIASEVGSEGLQLRRGDITLDDQALQPYVVLHADAAWSGTRTAVCFELLDTRGETRFVHEDEVLLRTGQNNVICTHRLPLGDKAAAALPGLWDLRITVDGQLVGLHTFDVGPSLRERQRLFAGGEVSLHRQASRLAEDETTDEDDSPISLEELLHGRQ